MAFASSWLLVLASVAIPRAGGTPARALIAQAGTATMPTPATTPPPPPTSGTSAATTPTDTTTTPTDTTTTPATTRPLPPPPDVAAGERSDGRIDPLPKRRWRLVPEILLFPLRALFWGLRWPIETALVTEDRRHVFHHLTDVITWTGGTRGLRPAFYYSTINIPEFGLKYFDHASLGVDTRLDVTTTVGGAHYVYSDLTVEPTRMSAPFGIIFDLSFDRRGDLLFNGLGSHTYSNAPNGRYLMNALESQLSLRFRPRHGVALFATFATGLKRFDNGDRVGGVPGIIFVYDTTAIPGFQHGTTFVRASTGFDLDTRRSPLTAATGVVVRGAFDYTHGIDGDTADYERLVGTVGVPIDLWQATHVLWLSATTAIAWQNDGVIPFSELPTLGGPNDLRGFRFQDFRDYSAFYATAEYRWPVWMWVQGALFVDYGGVFGQNYAGFGAQRMQPDVGVALRLVTESRFLMRVQLGYGFGEGVNFSISGTPQ